MLLVEYRTARSDTLVGFGQLQGATLYMDAELQGAILLRSERLQGVGTVHGSSVGRLKNV